MTIISRVSQDRRNASRVMARVDCFFTAAGTSHAAVIVNLSMKGAYLSAKHLPPNGSSITVELQPPVVSKPFSFDGTVLRGTWVMSDQGKRSRFGVRFDSTNPEILRLVGKLNSSN